jgi:adenosylcobinamide kinase/adenosylcobinamide-phosphate guanylyltransferase
VIVDCLTLLISNILLAEGAEEGCGPSQLERLEGLVMTEIDDILKTCRRIPAQVLLVANEVGMGVVPPSALGRMFRDIAGRVNQKVAAEADGVYFLVAGLAQKLK